MFSTGNIRSDSFRQATAFGAKPRRYTPWDRLSSLCSTRKRATRQVPRSGSVRSLFSLWFLRAHCMCEGVDCNNEHHLCRNYQHHSVEKFVHDENGKGYHSYAASIWKNTGNRQSSTKSIHGVGSASCRIRFPKTMEKAGVNPNIGAELAYYRTDDAISLSAPRLN